MNRCVARPSHGSRVSAAAFACLVAVSLLVSRPASASEPIALTPGNTRETRVKVVFEVNGKLAPLGSSRAQPLKAVGEFLYDEQIVDSGPREALRYYHQAGAEVAVNDMPLSVQLRPDRRLILANPASAELKFRALEGLLTRSEMDLIELPAGSHLVDQLLPGRNVPLGESWSHDDALLAQLLNLDSVTTNDVKTQLKSIDQGIAQLESAGEVTGMVAGASTEIQVQAKLSFDIEKGYVTWVALGLDENRKAGLVLPGLEAKSRVRLLREAATSTHLDDSVRTMLPTVRSGPKLLEFQPDSRAYLLTLDPRWHVFSQQQDLVVLRMVDQGRVLAQCNLRNLPPLPVGKQLELPEFQTDVRDALGSAARQIVDAREGALPNNLRQLRVSVVGEAAGLPIHWVYYHIDDADNNRVSCVFTMRAEDAEAFAGGDLTLVSGLTLAPGAPDDVPQPSPPQTEASAEVARKPEP